jgi:hypothetical protein
MATPPAGGDGSTVGPGLVTTIVEGMVQKRTVNCPICLDVMTSPSRLECRHVFCKGCILHFIEGEANPRCPACNVGFKRRQMVPAHDMGELVSIFRALAKGRPQEPSQSLSQSLAADDEEHHAAVPAVAQLDASQPRARRGSGARPVAHSPPEAVRGASR